MKIKLKKPEEYNALSGKGYGVARIDSEHYFFYDESGYLATVEKSDAEIVSESDSEAPESAEDTKEVQREGRHNIAFVGHGKSNVVEGILKAIKQASYPEIDIDVLEGRREEINQAIEEKYGCRDCNDCAYLNFTEKQQQRARKMMGFFPNHICIKLGVTVYHRANTREHASKIYPHPSCKSDWFAPRKK